MKGRKYSESELKKLKEIELEILSEIVRIADKTNIRYFVCGGTLIGAIRHNEFVPWDDDIDIGMFREDYEKFLSLVENELGDRFFLTNYEKIRNSHHIFKNLQKKRHFYRGRKPLFKFS